MPYHLATPQGAAGRLAAVEEEDRRAPTTAKMRRPRGSAQPLDDRRRGQDERSAKQLRGGRDPERPDRRGRSCGRAADEARRAPTTSRERDHDGPLRSESCGERDEDRPRPRRSRARAGRAASEASAPAAACCHGCVGGSLSTRSTVPRRCRQPGAPARRRSARLRARAAAAVVEEPVDAPGPAPLTSARNAPSVAQLRRRAASDARSFGGSAARSRGRSHARRARRASAVAPFVEAVRAVAVVERRVDRARSRASPRSRGRSEHDPVVLRQVERLQLAAVAGAELRAVGRGRTGRRRRAPPRRSCSSLGAAAARRSVSFASRSAVAASELPPPSPAATGIRFSISRASAARLPPPRRAARARARTSVSPAKPSTLSARRRLERDPVGEVDRAGARSATSCLPSSRSGPTTSARLILAGAGARLTGAPRRARRTPAARAPRRASPASTADRFERRGRVLARRDARRARASSASVLRRCANAAVDDPLHARVVRRQRAVRRKATSAESTFGRGRKTVRDTGWKPGALGDELDEHRDGAVRLRPRLGEEPVGDLALHHHAPELDRPAARRGSRRRAASRCCTGGSRRASSRPGASSTVERARPRRGASTLSRERRASCRLERAVELDRMDVRDALREVAREDAEPGADLEHDVVRPELREPADHAEDVLVDAGNAGRALLRSTSQSRSTPLRSRSICARARPAPRPRACGERGERVDDVRRLVRLAADGLRRKVRRSRSPQGSARQGPASPRARRSTRLWVGDVAGERDVPARARARLGSRCGDEKQWRTTVPS